MTEAAVIFGMQRCGSNFFLSACTRFEDLTVFGEMYHRGGVFPFTQNNVKDFAVKERLAWFLRDDTQADETSALRNWDFAAGYSPDSDGQLNRALVQFAHKFPSKYFRAITEAAVNSRVLLKIFPEHLSVFQILSLLHQHRPHVILMTRDPLDSFISYKKLTETKKPQDVDTSELKITFNRAEYYEYKAQLVAYFKAIADYCGDENIDVTTVSYDEVHREDEANKIEKVRSLVEHVFKTPVAVRPDSGEVRLFSKQDKSGSAAEKVLNPGQLPRLPQSLLGAGA